MERKGNETKAQLRHLKEKASKMKSVNVAMEKDNSQLEKEVRLKSELPSEVSFIPHFIIVAPMRLSVTVLVQLSALGTSGEEGEALPTRGKTQQ